MGFPYPLCFCAFITMVKLPGIITIILISTGIILSCKKNTPDNPGTLQLISIQVGNYDLDLSNSNPDVPVDSVLTIRFSAAVNPQGLENTISLIEQDDGSPAYWLSLEDDNHIIKIHVPGSLDYKSTYTIEIFPTLNGLNGETFAGSGSQFTTVNGTISIESVLLNGSNFTVPVHPRDIDWQDIEILVTFSEPIDTLNVHSNFDIAGDVPVNVSVSEDLKTVTVKNIHDLEYYSKYYFIVSENLKAKNGFTFDGFTNFFHTALDSSLKFPLISDEALLYLVQQQTFRYFYDFAHPDCGMTRERNTSGDIVTTGGSGFGVMALIVGVERQFITRAAGLEHLVKILTFLETCDRFHGAWSHWMYGSTGNVHPFGENDDGADLVETAYMIEGLMTMRQYLDPANNEEQLLIERVNSLIETVEWDWFTRGENVLYWHWSPNSGWAMNMKIQGYNEAVITYLLAASSVTHTIPAEAYHQGYALNGAIVNGNSYYGFVLPLGGAYGGPLFFTHYSYLGLDPRNLQDVYADYWQQNVNQSGINFSYCVDNPLNYIGYSSACWGLTASDNPWGYNAHSPTNDLGVITPSAAVSSLPYTPIQSMDAIRHFYYILGDRLWGPYGFYDAFDVTEDWWADSYIAIDQGPIVCMIENYRTGLLWDLFMSSPEIQQGLTKLGFTYQ